MERRRFNQTVSLQDRLDLFAQEAREKALQLRRGPERGALLKKARQAATAADLDKWANSPELQPPK